MTRDMSDNIGRMSFSCLIRLFMYICLRYLLFRHQIESKIWYHNGLLPPLNILFSTMVRFSDFSSYSFRFLLFVNCVFPTFPLCFPYSLVLLRILNQLITCSFIHWIFLLTIHIILSVDKSSVVWKQSKNKSNIIYDSFEKSTYSLILLIFIMCTMYNNVS